MVRENQSSEATTITIQFDEPDLHGLREQNRATCDRRRRASRLQPDREAEVKYGGAGLREVAAGSSEQGTARRLPTETVLALTAAVAQELHRRYRGNHVLDWLEAEILVNSVLDGDGTSF